MGSRKSSIRSKSDIETDKPDGDTEVNRQIDYHIDYIDRWKYRQITINIYTDICRRKKFCQKFQKMYDCL